MLYVSTTYVALFRILRNEGWVLTSQEVELFGVLGRFVPHRYVYHRKSPLRILLVFFGCRRRTHTRPSTGWSAAAERWDWPVHSGRIGRAADAVPPAGGSRAGGSRARASCPGVRTPARFQFRRLMLRPGSCVRRPVCCLRAHCTRSCQDGQYNEQLLRDEETSTAKEE